MAVGDVTGKGVAASVLMTATQGFLHAALLAHGDPARATTALNLFISPRREPASSSRCGSACSIRRAESLHYVDAGHSYAMLASADGTITPLDRGQGMPIAIDETQVYVADPAAARRRMMVVSDGIIEQFGLVDATGSFRRNSLKWTA